MYTETATATADAILALINSKPRTPTRDELVAVIAGHLEPEPPWAHPCGAAAHRDEWDTLMAASRAAEAGDGSEEGDAAVDAATTLVNECAERILQAPVRGVAEIKLLAEVFHWTMWADPAGLTDASLAEGPIHDASDEALAALLRGIRDL